MTWAGLDHSDYSTHQNQLILQDSSLSAAPTSRLYRSQGENALAQDMLLGQSNLDFVELLLKGADPNAQDHLGIYR
jgi:hypothetical protein